MAIEFRHAEISDLEMIIGTYNATIPSHDVTADLHPVTAESRINWFRAHNPGRRPLWLVMLNGQYAGWMALSDFYGREAYAGSAEVSVYIEHNVRKQGLGQACLLKAETESPRLGIHTLLGFIFAHNTTSLRLFETQGYRQWGILPEVANMNGTMRDLLILGKKVHTPGLETRK